ncbi:unnamed protein product [Musa acuminata subsp. burmannicoides]
MEGGETRYCDMDFFELAKIIFTRVQKLEPENVVKIMGCIFLKEPSGLEMLQLAFGPDTTLLSKVIDAKIMLGILSAKPIASYLTWGSHAFSSPTSLHVPLPYDHRPPPHNIDLVPRAYAESIADESSLYGQPPPADQLDATNHIGNYHCGGVALRSSRRSHSLSDLPIKACHYFNKGYCRHGMNCRYSHAQSAPDGYYPHVLTANMTDYPNDDVPFTPKSLENLEMEITELLRSRKGTPVSTASLPLLYFDKYGKNLQADGYLTESQRHGKAGLNLTKLLSHLKKSIRLIERPHGQHSVVLAEDAPRYMDCRNERSDSGSTVSSSHQIYLTFPAESTFSEDDVSNYFKQYGQVRDVRIPCQDKRMFGFVSFVHPETVNMILTKRNPHYICGARVLVKPYREKSRVIDRMYSEKMKPWTNYPSRYVGMDHDVHSVTREGDTSSLLRNNLIEKEMMMEHLSGLNLAPKRLTQQHYLTHGMEDMRVAEVPSDFFLDHFSYPFDAMNNGSTSDDKARQTSNPFSDQESSVELPESPFASPPVGSSISAVI